MTQSLGHPSLSVLLTIVGSLLYPATLFDIQHVSFYLLVIIDYIPNPYTTHLQQYPLYHFPTPSVSRSLRQRQRRRAHRLTLDAVSDGRRLRHRAV